MIRPETVYCLLLAFACPAVHAAEPTEVTFADRTAELGLELANSAACWADLNNDGWPELCAGGVVWKNEAGKKFTKLAEGVGTVVAADFDNDGFVDLFSWSSLQLFHNQAGEGFEPIPMPELPKCVSRGACLGDFDGDGFVDVYVGGYEDWNAGITYNDILLINDKGKALKVAFNDARYRTRGVTACDYDRDGDLDVYASNYRLQPNVLWTNDGTGKLQDDTAALNAVGTSAGFGGGHSIGSAWGDFDNDGEIDLFVGNFAHVDGRGDQPKSRFLKNVVKDGKHSFEDRGICGVFYQESYATPSAGDYDNDGDLDLFFTTVYGTASFGRKNNPVLFRNGDDLQFADANAAAQLPSLPPTYQAAWADFDHDGDLDLVAGGKLFQNNAKNMHWLAVKLEGDGKAVNRSAVGAQVRIKIGEKTLTRQVEAGTGEGNQNSLVLHFGLADHQTPVAVEVQWPDGTTQTAANTGVDQFAVVAYKK
jgi:enediyne biosynthesis protein E4